MEGGGQFCVAAKNDEAAALRSTEEQEDRVVAGGLEAGWRVAMKTVSLTRTA